MNCAQAKCSNWNCVWIVKKQHTVKKTSWKWLLFTLHSHTKTEESNNKNQIPRMKIKTKKKKQKKIFDTIKPKCTPSPSVATKRIKFEIYWIIFCSTFSFWILVLVLVWRSIPPPFGQCSAHCKCKRKKWNSNIEEKQHQ